MADTLALLCFVRRGVAVRGRTGTLPRASRGGLPRNGGGAERIRPDPALLSHH